MDTKQIWYVTGASKGLGLALVKKLLAGGHKVAATSRNAAQITTALGEHADLLPLQVDLTNGNSIQQSLAATVKKFGRVDVIVNNAGYGIGGSVEELSEQEIRDSFEINVFAPVLVIQNALPYLRAQRSGYIINISSIAGFSAGTGWSVYAATKFALMGMTDILAEDVREFGIKAITIAPGAFRTEFLTNDSLVLSEKTIEDYTAVRQSHAKLLAMNHLQAGDPDKAAEVMIELAQMNEPPVRLFLGTDAYNRATQKIVQLSADLEKNKELSFSTDFREA